MRTGLRLRGLRPRFVAAFILVTVTGASAAALASSQSAGDALVRGQQERITDDVANRVESGAATVAFPPDAASLERLRSDVGADVLVEYGGLRASSGAPVSLVTDELRRAVASGDGVLSQRVTTQTGPWLLVGSPVMRTEPDGAREPSGIEVYVARDLTAVEQQVDGLTFTALGAASLTLPISALVAVTAARGVLRPVRELRTAARRLAAGDLDARAVRYGNDELADLSTTVNEMADSLQTTLTRLAEHEADGRRFVADVSHELRTPLSTLTAVMEVLGDFAEQMAPEARESVDLAITETRRLVLLVEDLMEISRFDAGTNALQPQNVDLLELVRSTIGTRGWSDRVEVAISAGTVVRVDPRRCDVVIANLVKNALTHGAPPVRVDARVEDADVVIEVVDHGPGIDEHAIGHVFDRFYKADAARPRTVGNGLGLAIARENVHLHGGDISVSSTADTRFTIVLPAAAIS